MLKNGIGTEIANNYFIFVWLEFKFLIHKTNTRTFKKKEIFSKFEIKQSITFFVNTKMFWQ